MPSPAVTDAGHVAPSVIHLQRVTEGLRARLRNLEHSITFNLPALLAIHDDPCKPAQRELLGDVITSLRTALTETGAGD